MTRTICPKGVWAQILTGVTDASFNLTNEFPDPTQKSGYRIHEGTSAPAADTDDYIYVELDSNGKFYTKTILVSNTSSTNVYVLSMFDDGAVIA